MTFHLVSFNAIVAGSFLLLHAILPSDAYDPLDPKGNITILWDILTWTSDGDGYVAGVSIYNYQKYRHIEPPGWRLRWHWKGQEIIRSMDGAEAEMQGDCSYIHDNKPVHNCERTPTVVDLFPGQTTTTFDPSNSVGNMVANCCKGGVIASWEQDPANAVASFQMTVGMAGNMSLTAVVSPDNFTFQAPGLGYSCGPPASASPTLFSQDRRRHTQALLTWNVTCTYSKFLAQNEPSCCVSLSSFYSKDIVPCTTCSCACQSTLTSNDNCTERGPQTIPALITHNLMEPISPILQCSDDMCPIRIHWHVKQNYVSYWRVKLTVLNRNYAQNYSNWNVVAQHPNFKNLTEVFSFSYKLLSPYNAASDAALFWGIPFYNDMLMHAGNDGDVQTEILFRKDPTTFTFDNGWAFPERIYFNGHECVMPPPDAYPALPNSARTHTFEAALLLSPLLITIAVSLV